MQGVAELIEGLPRDTAEASAREEWLDARRLPPVDEERIRGLAPFTGAPRIWPTDAEEHLAVGFIFDPYVEIRTSKGASPRFFFRSWYRLVQYQRLVPAETPGCVRAAFPRGPQP
jgi:hypothetical protein